MWFRAFNFTTLKEEYIPDTIDLSVPGLGKRHTQHTKTTIIILVLDPLYFDLFSKLIGLAEQLI